MAKAPKAGATDLNSGVSSPRVSAFLNSPMNGWIFFGAFFLVPVFSFFVGGWFRLELCHFCKLWQEKTLNC